MRKGGGGRARGGRGGRALSPRGSRGGRAAAGGGPFEDDWTGVPPIWIILLAGSGALGAGVAGPGEILPAYVSHCLGRLRRRVEEMGEVA